MATPIRMPLMGMTMEEGVVSEWLVDEGAEITKGQEILEFETDKINARVEAPADGLLGGVVAQSGDAVKVQGLLAWVLEAGETAPAEDPDPPGGGSASEAEPAAPVPQVPVAAPATQPPPPAPVPPPSSLPAHGHRSAPGPVPLLPSRLLLGNPPPRLDGSDPRSLL